MTPRGAALLAPAVRPCLTTAPSCSSLRQRPIEIAPGCSITYELETIDILRGLVRVTTDRQEALRRYYEEFAELHGARPRALEAFHEGYNP